MRRLVAVAVASTLLLSSARGRAQETPGCDLRLHAVTDTLTLDAHATRTWYWAWMAIGGALIAGQGGLAAAVKPGNFRTELIVGSASSVFIPTALLVKPPPGMHDDHGFDAPPGDSCFVLASATQHVARNAADQALRTSAFAHTFIIAGNFALGLLLGVGFHDWPGGVKQTVGGLIISELEILTVPTASLKLQGLGFVGTF